MKWTIINNLRRWGLVGQVRERARQKVARWGEEAVMAKVYDKGGIQKLVKYSDNERDQ